MEQAVHRIQRNIAIFCLPNLK